MNNKSIISRNWVRVIITLAVAGFFSSAQATVLTYDGTSAGARDNFTGVVGTKFTVGGSDVLINYLGFEDAGGDGLTIAHTVELWSSSTTLERSVTVGSGTSAFLQDAWRFVSIDAFTLLANATYWLGGTTVSGSGDAFTDTGAALFGLGSGIVDADPTNAFCKFAGCGFPASDGGLIDLRWGPANATYIPLPTTLALFGLGLAGLGWSKRKKA
ncbi:PEP-CTERM sorting domain-containing protein [Halieaceae bacterium IMCC14734]|uniref:PEP-CTERM sorting domain-containing protein n=1 Tax=Candidatus Litorirhabdus singularis TaxID=2518993 RepID=A0ABT3TBQ4_9GAMM|nr:PEP-CTERM sorting domain-containing protein [Candidatus Litorirhabdus singularis]MCX2979459.1 PEP-CTERM sorting domain-containing protein [Candidatus Litorirhabdus singularis]